MKKALIFIFLIRNSLLFAQSSQDNLISTIDSLYLHGNPELAFSKLIEEEKKGVESPYIYHRLGMVYLERRDPEKAMQYLYQAQDYSDDDSLSNALHMDLGQAHYMVGNYNGAIRELELLINDSYYRFYALSTLAAIYSDIREYIKTSGIPKELFTNNLLSESTIINIGCLFLDKNLYDSAIYFFKWSLEFYPNNPVSMNYLGFSQYKKGNNELALELINSSISIDPANAYFYRNRGIVFISLNNISQACDDFAKAISLDYLEMYGDDILKYKTIYCD